MADNQVTRHVIWLLCNFLILYANKPQGQVRLRYFVEMIIYPIKSKLIHSFLVLWVMPRFFVRNCALRHFIILSHHCQITSSHHATWPCHIVRSRHFITSSHHAISSHGHITPFHHIISRRHIRHMAMSHCHITPFYHITLTHNSILSHHMVTSLHFIT